MLRTILAAVVGYVVIVIVVMAGIGIAWAVLGGEGAFAGEGPEPSTVWMILNLVSGLVAAFAGGWAARKVGQSFTAVKILIGIILVLGLYSVLTAEAQYEAREQVEKPVAEMTFMEAGFYAKQPAWYTWIVPLVGAAGAWIGGQERHK